MKKLSYKIKYTPGFIVIVLLMFVSINTFGQVHFETGYFISNDGAKTDCLIKNEDWYNNPTEFKYKLLAKAKTQTGKIADVKEFAINDYAKYVRADVNVDVSSSRLGYLTNFSSPIWKKMTVFLKILVDGKATLYLYRESDLDDARFFYKHGDSEIKQLVYKEYLRDHTVAVNDSFKIQLNDHVKCESCGISTGEFPDYHKRDLVNYFIRYNQCVDPSFKEVHIKYKRNILHIGLYAGVDHSSLTVTNNEGDYLNGIFKKKPSLHAGINIEYVLPFDKNQWTLFAEPEYDQFMADLHTEYINHVDYKSINLSFGIKRYFFLTDQWQLFISGQIHSLFSDNFDVHKGSQTYYISGAYPYSPKVNYEVQCVPNIAIGVGAEYKHFYVEIRGYTNQHIEAYGIAWIKHFNTLSLNIGYKLFNLSSKGSK